MPDTTNTTPIEVLCIEDDKFIGNIYARALNSSGYKTTLEENGRKGLEMAQTGAYHIILLDLMLPELSGIEIIKILRDPQKTPNFSSKIIIFTNVEENKNVREDIERHADGYLVKASVTPRQLVDYLNNIDVSSVMK